MSRSELHIALCTDGVFPQAMGGMQRHSRLLAEELARTPGVRLTVIHPHTAPIFDARLGITEVTVEPVDASRFYLRELWRYSERVANVLERIAPDVVLSQGFSVWSGIERFTKKLIVNPHGLEMFQGITLRDQLIGAPFRFTLRNILRRSAVCISLGGRLDPILQQQVRGADTRVIPFRTRCTCQRSCRRIPWVAAPCASCSLAVLHSTRGLICWSALRDGWSAR